MTRPLLILRPEPGASATAARARAIGLDPVVAPLFTISPLTWESPDPSRFEAVLLTSANAARFGPPALHNLPCYAVGSATALAAGQAGFVDIRIGPSDGMAAASMMAADGTSRAIHPCGRHHIELDRQGIAITALPVYAADAVGALPQAASRALAEGAAAMLHSPRAASLFASWVPRRAAITVLAISPATADAAGDGWALKAVPAAPRDEALLELAVQLCQTSLGDETGNGG